jgi:serine phosphatase RsbU (regulator of sigma subunit)
LHLGRDGGVTAVPLRPGPPPGAFPRDDYPITTAQIERGEALVLFTDGITEARRDGRLFGEEGAAAAIRDCAGLSAQGIADRLCDAVVEYAEELRDDVDILVVRHVASA